MVMRIVATREDFEAVKQIFEAQERPYPLIERIFVLDQRALARGLDQLQLPVQDPAPAAQCTLDAVDAALERLAQLREADRHRMVEGAAATVSEDGLLKPQELLLLRAVADRLNVLIPSAVELLEQDAPGALLDP